MRAHDVSFVPMPNVFRPFAVALAVVGLAAGLVSAAASPAAAARPTKNASVAGPLVVHPGAAAQPTATGRQLTDLQFFEGSIYAGYGDYGVNTGPIQVSSVDSSGAVLDRHVQDTEAIYNYRVLGGKLYSPSIDPRTASDFASSDPWADTDATDAVHVFDMNTLTGDDLWMVGSKGQQAAAWRSLDGGQTWQESLLVDPGTDTTFARFYFAGVLAGKLYVQAFDSGSGAAASSMVFDGTSWTTGPAITGGWFTGWRPVEFDGKLVMHGSGHGRTAPIFVFDGTTVTDLGWGYDVDVAGRDLYRLDDTGLVTKTANLQRWSKVGQAPTGAISLASDGRTTVVGTVDSAIWKL